MPVEPTVPLAEAPPPSSGPHFSWFHKFSAVLFCVFCFELGLFLLVYPWMGAWETNFFLTARPEWTKLLLSAELRGAVSGLGILNIFIALAEVFRLRRFAGS